MNGKEVQELATDGKLLQRCAYITHQQYKLAGPKSLPGSQWWICASCHPARSEVVKFLDELEVSRDPQRV